MKVDKALEEFILACEANGLSPASIRWYRSLLGAFVASFWGDITGITTHDLREYVVALRKRDTRYIDAPQKPEQEGGLSHASVKGHITALHAFWNWCSKEYDTPNPMINIKRPKRQSPQPKAIVPRDFVKLFNATLDNAAGKRDRAILCFLADTGCRLNGLLTLKLENLFLQERRALVYEKGNQERMVVFTRFTAHILRDWLSDREADCDCVFCSMRTGQPLTDSGLHQMLKRLKLRAGVQGRVNPHSFRHGFAREYLRAGGDLATLAHLMGHENVNTTSMYYAVFDIDELADLHEKFSPLRSLLKNH